MDTLHPLLVSLQEIFKRSHKKGQLFSAVILAMILPIGTAMSSHIHRKLEQVLYFSINKTRFYRFMASKTFNWDSIWMKVFKLIPSPTTNGRLIVALDDSMTPKSGKKIFGCEHFFDHAAKHNQSQYPWSQCFVQIGLLKIVHTRWAFLPLLTRFYHSVNKAVDPDFKSKITIACELLYKLSTWSNSPILVVTDSWFGNGKLYNKLRDDIGDSVEVLTMLRKNSVLYETPVDCDIKKPGRPSKYGSRAGSVKELAIKYKAEAREVTSLVYGKERKMLVHDEIFMSKAFKCKIRVVFTYYKNHFVAIATTDLNLTVEEILEYYSARWKIESGFKELKHDIGSQKSQVRLKHSVTNHLNMCMLSITIIWIATMSLPKQCVNELTHNGIKPQYSFAQARKLLIDQYNKLRVCKNDPNLQKNNKALWLNLIIKLAA
jgi:hypothetical protein